jgi:hypothetical protein
MGETYWRAPQCIIFVIEGALQKLTNFNDLPGIGRSGAFCAIDIVLRRLRFHYKLVQDKHTVPKAVIRQAVDLKQVVIFLRKYNPLPALRHSKIY